MRNYEEFRGKRLNVKENLVDFLGIQRKSETQLIVCDSRHVRGFGVRLQSVDMWWVFRHTGPNSHENPPDLKRERRLGAKKVFVAAGFFDSAEYFVQFFDFLDIRVDACKKRNKNQ